MQTVNFNCPHCGNLMAVGTNLLGRNVRCPHCKTVVRAPAAPGDPPPPPPPPAPPPVHVPQFNLPEQTEHHESIFGERHEEDVFGTEPMKPAVPPPVSLPGPPPTRSPALQETVGLTEPIRVPRPGPIPEYEPLPDDPPPRPWDGPAAPGDTADDRDDSPALRAPPEEAASRRYQARAPRAEGPAAAGTFAWLLLGYGAFITLVAAFFAYQYFAGGSSRHPFEAIPDVYGQYEKANRRQTSFQGFPDPKADVPPQLRVKLGGELAVGDLQVRPVSVERQVLRLVQKKPAEGDEPESRPLAKTTLVLKLHVKNLSADTSFHPNDPAFNRAHYRPVDKVVPYTALEFRSRFHYGPLPWPPEPEYEDAYLVGFGLEKDARPLAPGAEADVFVAVAAPGSRPDANQFEGVIDQLGRNDLPAADPFLWRVQLRRGLVKGPADGTEVEMSATTVIGVVFAAGDVK